VPRDRKDGDSVESSANAKREDCGAGTRERVEHALTISMKYLLIVPAFPFLIFATVAVVWLARREVK
jgi:hypothetical protein